MQATLESIREAWSRMTADGLDLTQALEWGFFFMHDASAPLNEVRSELEAHGYVVKELGERDDGTWVLHVSKVELLEPEKLHRRNLAFNELAAHIGVALYDGWDVTVPRPGRQDA